MDKLLHSDVAHHQIIVTIINKQINCMCGNVELKELNNKDMLDIIDCINQCFPGIIISKDLIDDLCAKNSFFAYAIKYHTLFAVQNYNHTTWNTLPIVTNPQEQQPIRFLDKSPQPIKEYVMLAAQHQSALRIAQEKCDATYLLNTAINNTTHSIPAHELFNSPLYNTLERDRKYAVQEKLVKKNVTLERAQLELKKICANRNVLRADLEYNF
jgi:hypothetical protein